MELTEHLLVKLFPSITSIWRTGEIIKPCQLQIEFLPNRCLNLVKSFIIYILQTNRREFSWHILIYVWRWLSDINDNWFLIVRPTAIRLIAVCTVIVSRPSSLSALHTANVAMRKSLLLTCLEGQTDPGSAVKGSHH